MTAKRFAAGLWRWLALLVLCSASLLAGAQELAPIPPLTARVTDTTATLSAAQRDALEQRLAALEKDKGSQIAVLIVPTTQPEAIEQYGIRVAEAWKVGRKGVDDGVILLVAKQDRKLRIEVGYGLEGAIPDAIAKRIIAEIIAPHFKQGDFAGGINAGVDAIAARIAGEPLPAPARHGPASSGSSPTDWLVMLLIGTVVIGSVLRALLGRVLGAGATSALVGGGAWLLTTSTLIGLVAAGLAFVFVLAQSGGGRRGYGSGFGGPWGGSGGGWSGGGGSWSGGGGGFGGGGASGDW